MHDTVKKLHTTKVPSEKTLQPDTWKRNNYFIATTIGLWTYYWRS